MPAAIAAGGRRLRRRHVADHGGDDDRADPENPGQGRAGDPDRHRQFLPRLPQQGIDAAQVGRELGGQLGADLGYDTARPSLGQDLIGLIGGYLLGEATGDQLAQHGVQPAGDLIASGSGRGAAWPRSSAPPRGNRARTGRHDGERSAAGGICCVIATCGATCANAGPGVVRNPTLRWLPSQNGLLADAPHRHSATRVSCLTSVWS
jgi:hypothetical protein